MEQWPTSKLVGVGLVILFTAGSGLGLSLRGARAAWDQGEIAVFVSALAVAVFFGFWLVIMGQFVKVLLRRGRGNRLDPGATIRKEFPAAEAKDKAETKQA